MSAEVGETRTLVYGTFDGQVLVTIWPDGSIDVATRSESSGIWGPPLHLIREERS